MYAHVKDNSAISVCADICGAFSLTIRLSICVWLLFSLFRTVCIFFVMVVEQLLALLLVCSIWGIVSLVLYSIGQCKPTSSKLCSVTLPHKATGGDIFTSTPYLQLQLYLLFYHHTKKQELHRQRHSMSIT